jgi:hypothetical protein
VKTHMILPGALLCLAIAQSTAGQGPSAGKADFSGTWTFDRAKSSQPGPDGRIVIAPILGDECLARQDGAALTLAIKAGTLNVTAVYSFEGESRNLSPAGPGEAETLVTSRVWWDGDRLVILSSSTATVQGRGTRVDTKRVIWLDENNDLIIVRTGTPPSEVTPSRSVYRRVPDRETIRAQDGAPARVR